MAAFRGDAMAQICRRIGTEADRFRVKPTVALA
jgi:hypothetical protein